MDKLIEKDFDTKDRSSRHVTDGMLRRRGFTIFSRVRGQEPVWIRAGVLYKQSKAEAVTYRENTKGD